MRIAVGLLSIATFAGICDAFPPGVRAVRAGNSPGGDGLTWGSAFSDLQLALAAARADPSITELWIAAGAYYVAPPGSPPDSTFDARHLSLYGGFSGFETSRGQREPNANVTTLSGDLNRDGLYNAGDCGPVLTVTAAGSEEIDGLRIVGGYLADHGDAAGISCFGSAVFRGCTIVSRATGLTPRGMRLESGSQPIRFERCAIDCWAHWQDTILYSDGVTFEDCELYAKSIKGLHPTLHGTGTLRLIRTGAVLLGDDWEPLNAVRIEAVDSRFRLGNYDGGGGPSLECVDGDLSRCEISLGSVSGGLSFSGELQMRDCRVVVTTYSNKAGVSGSAVDLENCIFIGGQPLGPYFQGNSGRIVGCTFTGIQTGRSQPLIRLGAGCVLTNAIVSGNDLSGAAIALPPGASGLVTWSCVQGWDGSLGGEGNFALDPIMDASGRLGALSPCIDAGSNAALTVPHDIDGNCRVSDGNGDRTARVDMGACEFTLCAADCDCATGGPVLTVGDLICFLSRFNGGEAWANCDGSTSAPVLNVLDFNCFLNRFTAGCP